MSNVLSGLNKIIRIYKKPGFKDATLYGNKEFKPFKDVVYDKYESAMNCSCAQEHVPKAKNNNKVIKEHTQAAYHATPLQAITRLMTKYLVMEAIQKLNFFPPRGGISPYYSPGMIFHCIPLDYNKVCHIPIFTYGVAHEEPNISNTQAVQGIDALYLHAENSI